MALSCHFVAGEGMRVGPQRLAWRGARWPTRFRPKRASRVKALLLILCITLIGCRSQHSGGKPSIKFIDVPLAGPGNADKFSSIKGRVRGVGPGLQIVLYAKVQTTWWVQPFADQPFTRIQSNSEWSNSTHPGTEYAALLVGPGFRPPLTTDVLPTEGVVAMAVVPGEPPFERRWWFALGCVIGGALVIFGIYRLRLHQMTAKLNVRFEERLAERTRVAQELHDTLLQGFVSAAMQLHVADTYLPADSPAKPLLGHVLELMGNVIDEGRNAIRGLRTFPGDGRDLEQAFSSIPQELAAPTPTDLRVIVEGVARPLRPVIHDEVYLIGREGLVNAFRHSRASQIEAELDFAADHFRLLIRDNGSGIDPQVLAAGREGHWGLSGMRERAERMGARLRVLSRPATGTEVELSVPGEIAFDPRSNGRAAGWLSKLYSRNRNAQESQGRRD